MLLFFCVFIIFFPQVSDSLSLLLYSLHVRLLRALIKINQSINQRQGIPKGECGDGKRTTADSW